MSQVKRGKSKCYCINLRRAANAVSALYDGYLEPTGLSVTQFSLLRNLDRLENCSVSDLASFVGLERTTLVRTLKPLLDQGLVEDTAQAGRRNRSLRLTDEGRHVMELGGPMWDEAQAAVVQRLGEENIPLLEEFLQKLL